MFGSCFTKNCGTCVRSYILSTGVFRVRGTRGQPLQISSGIQVAVTGEPADLAPEHALTQREFFFHMMRLRAHLRQARQNINRRTERRGRHPFGPGTRRKRALGRYSLLRPSTLIQRTARALRAEQRECPRQARVRANHTAEGESGEGDPARWNQSGIKSSERYVGKASRARRRH